MKKRVIITLIGLALAACVTVKLYQDSDDINDTKGIDAGVKFSNENKKDTLKIK